MKTKLIIFKFIFAGVFIFGQYKFLDVPKLDIKDVSSAQYEKNPSEAAEVLYRSYHYWIEYNGQMNIDVISTF